MSPPQRQRKKRSIYWSLFDPIDSNNKQARCQVCNEIVAYSGNSSNLRSHLERHHKERLSAFEAEQPEESQGAGKPKQLRVEECFAKSSESKYPSSSKRSRELMKALIRMIAIDNQPFSIVEDPGFINFVHLLDPKYVLPTRKELVNSELVKLYQEEKKEVERILNTEVKDITITTDMWTDTHNMTSYISKTAHFSDSEFNIHNISLETTYFSERHTAQNLREDLLQCWERWNINNKVRTVVKDNAANIGAAVCEIPNVDGLECFAHALNLVVRDALAFSFGVEPLTDKCRQIVHIFKSSALAASKLKDYQREKKRTPILTLKKDVPTRWNSTLIMLCSVLALKEDLPTVLSFLQKPNVPMLVYNEWEVIEEIVKMLRPFEAATREMSGNYVSVSKVIQIVKCLQDAMENVSVTMPVVEQLRQNLKRETSSRFGEVENNKILCRSTICDPRFKTVLFSSEEKKSECKTWILEEMQANTSMEKDDTSTPAVEFVGDSADDDPDDDFGEPLNEHDYSHEPPTYYRDDSLWASYDRKVASHRKTDEVRALDMEIEFKRYIDYPILDRKEDPMMWWKKEGRNLFPNVAKLARKYLPIPATSVQSERIFSKCGVILSDRRTRLKSKHVDKLVFLSVNRRT